MNQGGLKPPLFPLKLQRKRESSCRNDGFCALSHTNEAIKPLASFELHLLSESVHLRASQRSSGSRGLGPPARTRSVSAQMVPVFDLVLPDPPSFVEGD